MSPAFHRCTIIAAFVAGTIYGSYHQQLKIVNISSRPALLATNNELVAIDRNSSTTNLMLVAHLQQQKQQQAAGTNYSGHHHHQQQQEEKQSTNTALNSHKIFIDRKNHTSLTANSTTTTTSSSPVNSNANANTRIPNNNNNNNSNNERELLLPPSITIIMPTYKRPKTALASVIRYRCMKSVSMIIVRWNDPTSVPPPELVATTTTTATTEEQQSIRTLDGAGKDNHGANGNQTTTKCAKVLIVRGPNNINNRFEPIEQIATEAILSLDDDIEMTERSLAFAFRVWQENRDRLIGFRSTSRAFSCTYGKNEPNCGYSYTFPETVELTSMVGFNTALTGATIFAKHYLNDYFSPPMDLLRNHVSAKFNCEDLLMNAMIANLTNGGPIIVPDEIAMNKLAANAEKPGLSKKGSHVDVRVYCGKLFASLFPPPVLKQALGAKPSGTDRDEIVYCNTTTATTKRLRG